MDAIVAKHNADIVAGVRHLMDAIGCLGRVRNELTHALKRLPPGDPVEAVALGAQRAVSRMTEAACAVPDDFFSLALALDPKGLAISVGVNIDSAAATAAAMRLNALRSQRAGHGAQSAPSADAPRGTRPAAADAGKPGVATFAGGVVTR